MSSDFRGTFYHKKFWQLQKKKFDVLQKLFT